MNFADSSALFQIKHICELVVTLCGERIHNPGQYCGNGHQIYKLAHREVPCARQVGTQYGQRASVVVVLYAVGPSLPLLIIV